MLELQWFVISQCHDKNALLNAAVVQEVRTAPGEKLFEKIGWIQFGYESVWLCVA
jgi:hypothetical protein